MSIIWHVEMWRALNVFLRRGKIAEEKGITVKWTRRSGGAPSELLEYRSGIKVDWPLIGKLIRTQKDSRVSLLRPVLKDPANSGKTDEAVSINS